MDAFEAFCLFDILVSVIFGPFLLWDYHSKKGISVLHIFFYAFGIIFTIYLFYRMAYGNHSYMNWG